MTPPPGPRAPRPPDGSYPAAWDALTREAGVRLVQREVTLNGADTRVFTAGEGADLILLHGAGATGASWLPLVPHMPGHRLHLVDLPGFGFGAHLPWDDGDPRDRATRIVDDLLAQICPEGAALAGNSFGGWILMAWALARPKQQLPLTVVGLAPGLMNAPVPRLTALRGLEAHGITDGPLVEALSVDAGPPPRLFAEPERVSAAYRELEKALWRSPESRRSWAAVLRAMLTTRGELAPAIELSQALETNPRSFTYVFGTEDPYLAGLDPRPDRVPGAVPIAVPGGGHLPWFERPRALARILNATEG